ncbi:MAG: hypothetical protein HY300_07705 [Verrucomicrobia bacterium]|nr:hypothetical protein [Verrucomicrobiota bacterium]
MLRLSSSDTLAALKKMMQKSHVPLQPFQTGQVWEWEGSNVKIGLVGKTLVHYKHFRGGLKRAAVSLANKRTLEKFLQDQNAVLVQP